MVTVPYNLDGEYVLELWAVDNAGNEAYLCKMVFVITGHEVTSTYMDGSYVAREIAAGYSGELTLREILVKVGESEMTAKNEDKKIGTCMIEGGYKVEHTVCCRDTHGSRRKTSY